MQCNPYMGRSDLLPRYMPHASLARPEAQLPACRNECRTALRSFQRNAPVVVVVRHARLCEERQCSLHIANELAMGEGIGDEIARGRLLHPDLDAVCRR